MLQMDLFHATNPASFDIGAIIEPDELDDLYSRGLFEELAKKVKLEVASSLMPYTGGSIRSREQLLHNNGQGDMFLSQDQKQKLMGTKETSKRRVARQGVIFDNVYYNKWPMAVPYVISKNYTPEHRQLIEQSIFNFNFLVQNEMLVPRITGQRDYIFIMNGEGCSSHVGKNGGPQVVTLSQPECMERGVIIHEIFHTLGMVHEHNRPDRDQYIRIINENIPEDWKEQYIKYNASIIEMLGDYDFYSIMHYPLNAPDSKKPAIEILKSGVNITEVGQRIDMTDTDIKKIKKLYSLFPIDIKNLFQLRVD